MPRNHYRLPLASVAFLALWAQPALAQAPECVAAVAAAEAMIAEAAGNPIVFSDQETMAYAPPAGEWRDVTTKRTIPLPAAVRALFPPKQTAPHFRREASALLACDSVRNMLRGRGIHYGAEAVDMAIEPRDGRAGPRSATYAAGILSLSRPVLSADGRHALIYTGATFGGLAGHGRACYLHRGDTGEWRIVGCAITWLS